ncbi:MAG: GTP cyclohydrolase I FolE2 [Nitrososphaerota archaeon]|nr:GTP cyclohydrolase I FolE2 [Nitrososphaerota archaeon]MDG7051579.1 GTP cyclohydrolase I FolE2 [Nitrososphaerota archaeon]
MNDKEKWKAVSAKSKDVQYEKPVVPIAIDRVGFRGIFMPLNSFSRPPVIYSSGRVSVMVDLPPYQRGINMSRTMIGVTDRIGEGKADLEELAPSMAKRLLELHEYSTKSRIRIGADGYLTSSSPISGLESHEHFGVKIGAVMTRSTLLRIIGVTITGISTCPCGAELMRSALEHGPETSGLMPTHMQRAKATLLVSLHGENRITIPQLLTAVSESMSGSTHSVLKRSDEGFVIYSALKNPKFVEDIYRSIAREFMTRYPDLDESTRVYISVVSEESIHNFNASASGWSSYRDLKELLH